MILTPAEFKAVCAVFDTRNLSSDFYEILVKLNGKSTTRYSYGSTVVQVVDTRVHPIRVENYSSEENFFKAYES